MEGRSQTSPDITATYRVASQKGTVEVTLSVLVPDALVEVEILAADTEGVCLARLAGEVMPSPLADLGGALTDLAAVLTRGTSTSARRRSGSAEPAYHLEDLRQVHPNSHRRWSEDEEQRLRDRFTEGVAIPELVTEFGRNEGGITSRLQRLGLIGEPTNQSISDNTDPVEGHRDSSTTAPG
ncbi:MAG: hypothetical protein GXX79_10225 [Actinomycetales bacterium]|nr:hypothetical protein [Actinomycetales bacterium]